VKKTNINGSAIVIEAGTDAGVGRVIAMSTDKAFERRGAAPVDRRHLHGVFGSAGAASAPQGFLNPVTWHRVEARPSDCQSLK
jgi:hypothetical protein